MRAGPPPDSLLDTEWGRAARRACLWRAGSGSLSPGGRVRFPCLPGVTTMPAGTQRGSAPRLFAGGAAGSIPWPTPTGPTIPRGAPGDESPVAAEVATDRPPAGSAWPRIRGTVRSLPLPAERFQLPRKPPSGRALPAQPNSRAVTSGFRGRRGLSSGIPCYSHPTPSPSASSW
jgi:hypothetical protein